MPLSSSLIRKDVAAELDRRDVAVCIACYGEKVDESKRDGAFRSVVIMSQPDAEWFVNEVKRNPCLVFNLIKNVNKGPIRKFDGSPACSLCVLI